MGRGTDPGPADPGQAWQRLVERLEHPDAANPHPGLFRLRQLLVGELSEAEAVALQDHLAGCETCRIRWGLLTEEAHRFLDDRPVEPFLRALEQRRVRTATTSVPATPVRTPWPARLRGWFRPSRLAWGASLAVAAVLVLVLWPGGSEQPTDPLRSTTRLKAGVELSYDVLTPAGSRPGQSGAVLHVGDRIQVRATSPSAGYLLVLSLDARGLVTPFYDEQGASLPLPAGVGQPLAGSIVLDDARGPERIVGCFSPRPLRTADAVAEAQRALRRAGHDPLAVEQLELPCVQAGFTFRKE